MQMQCKLDLEEESSRKTAIEVNISTLFVKHFILCIGNYDVLYECSQLTESEWRSMTATNTNIFRLQNVYQISQRDVHRNCRSDEQRPLSCSTELHSVRMFLLLENFGVSYL